MKHGRETQATQRAGQGAGRDGGDEWREELGRAVGRVWSASDDDQHLEAGAGAAGRRAVRARGKEGRGPAAADDRRVVPADWPVAGRAGFLGRAARTLPAAERRAMIERTPKLSVAGQCALLGVARSSAYYRPAGGSEEELELMRRIDRIFTEHPVYGSRRIQVALARQGTPVGRRRVRRLMRKQGLWAVGPRRDTSRPHPAHPVYPYLLRGLKIEHPQVSATRGDCDASRGLRRSEVTTSRAKRASQPSAAAAGAGRRPYPLVQQHA